MRSPEDIATFLAYAFVAGPMEVERLVEIGATMLGRKYRWLRRTCESVARQFAFGRPRGERVAKFILQDATFQSACARLELRVRKIPRWAAAGMRPAAGLPPMQLPELLNEEAVAEWLNVKAKELAWLADRREMERKRDESPLHNYRYRPLAKRFGRLRLIEAPKPRLRELQRRVLHDLLDRVPVHSAAHGFCRGRSIKSFAAPHVGRAIVMRIDLEDFFPTITVARVRAIFWTLGYPASVADLLAALCTNSAPEWAWDGVAGDVAIGVMQSMRWLYAAPHLPQGAPTSPALANLAAYRLDCRLAAFTEAAGGVYTRYADDLAFSGDEAFAKNIERFQTHVCATILEERFKVNFRKLRIMRRGVRQHLAGVVVNGGTNVRRDEFDQLKAILHNCARFGPAEQNHLQHADFRAHLAGRIAHVSHLNPARGAKLRSVFERIVW